MPTPVHSEMFYHEGRGPELQRVHWDATGVLLAAIDYYNPDDAHDEQSMKHVLFVRPEVVMITFEEVIAYSAGGSAISGDSAAAIFDLGRSEWLRSFSPRHLDKCSHFQLYFYDELFDVIAERVECREGGFAQSQGTAT